MAAKIKGPHLAAAVLCEKVLQEKDGVLSLIRVFDRIIHTVEGPQVPAKMPPVPITLTAFLSFKSGTAKGRRTVTIKVNSPSGARIDGPSLPVLFEGEDRGVNLIVNLALQAEHEGLYWIDVLLDDRVITRMPLMVVYRRISSGTSTASD